MPYLKQIQTVSYTTYQYLRRLSRIENKPEKQITLLIAFLLIETTLAFGDIFMDGAVQLRNLLFVVTGLLVCIVAVVIRRKKIELSHLSVAAIFLLSFMAARNLRHFDMDSIYEITGIAMLAVLGGYKVDSKLLGKTLTGIIIIECIVCLLQMAHILSVPSSSYIATGTFDSPTAFGLIVALGMPFMLHAYRQSSNRVILFTILLSLALTIALGCRTAIACVVVTFLYYYKDMICRMKKLYRYSAAILLTALTILLVIWKWQSSVGHLLIVEVTSSMLAHMPFLGYGTFGFQRLYMEHQLEFLQNASSLYSVVADNPMHPLNEYLSIILNIGMAGACGLFCLFSVLLKYWNIFTIETKCCILILLLSSLFTYTFKYSFVWVFSVICCIACSRHISLRIPQWIARCIIISLIVVVSVHTWNYVVFELKWRNLYHIICTVGVSDDVISSYTNLERGWNGNPMFYYNFAAVLRENSDFAASNKVLRKYAEYVTDYYAITMNAQNNFSMGIYTEALQSYKKASRMCPVRFMPLQGMMHCYQRMGDVPSARKTALLIVNKEVKIPSHFVSLMKREAQDYLLKE